MAEEFEEKLKWPRIINGEAVVEFDENDLRILLNGGSILLVNYGVTCKIDDETLRERNLVKKLLERSFEVAVSASISGKLLSVPSRKRSS